jgi:hypothetical protein
VKVLFKIIQKVPPLPCQYLKHRRKNPYILHLNNAIRMTPQLPSTRARKTPIEVTPKNPKGIESLRLGHLSFLSSSAASGLEFQVKVNFFKRYLGKKGVCELRT